MNKALTVETPSGKGAADENFPVGSWLLPRQLRPHVAAFYAFARAIDDIADNPHLTPEGKITRLERFAAVLSGEAPPSPGLEKAADLRRSNEAAGVTTVHGLDLISAFKQDAVKLRYESWDDLIDYCNRSAAPVGRYLLDLHGEDTSGYPASDALCNALQVLNHLQDCQSDYRNLNRVYLPEPWLQEAGETVDCLDRTRTTHGLRAVIDRCLEGTRKLLQDADSLPGRLRSRRLAMESAVIVAIAWKLVDELVARDPLAERVVLTRPQFFGCGVAGVWKGLTA